MKISCMQEDLNKGLSIIKRAISNKTIMTSLQAVLLNACLGEIKLTATDLTLTIMYEFPAVVESQGQIAVMANTFSEVISRLPHDRIDIDTDTKLRIRCHRHSSNISLIDPASFPEMAQATYETQVKIKSSVFLQALKQVEFAILNNVSKPTLNGICFEITDTTLNLVATDMTQMSYSRIPLSKQYPGTKVVIPAKTVEELIKSISNDDKEIFIDVSPTQIKFTIGDNIVIYSCLIAGNFPNYQAVIPTGSRTQAIISTREFLESLNLASIFTSEKKNISINITQNKIIVSSGFEEIGDNESSIDALVTGEDLKVAFNSTSMLDALSNIQQDKIVIQANTPNTPMVVKPVGYDNYIFVIAPVYRPGITE